MENQRTTVLLACARYFGGGVAFVFDWIGSTHMSLSGVPQLGSVIGPLLFAVYISPVDNVVAAHRVHRQQYADDTQHYVAVRPSDVSPFDVVSHCVSDIPCWCLENGMYSTPARLKQFCSELGHRGKN